MRHYLGYQTKPGAVTFLGELPDKRLSHEEIGRYRTAEPGWRGYTELLRHLELRRGTDYRFWAVYIRAMR